MAHKQMLFRSEAREKILRGAAALADAVRVTLGPKSKGVWMECCVYVLLLQQRFPPIIA